MTKIKICGLCRPEDVESVNAARPDYAGFVVNYPRSRRSLDVGKLERLRAALAPGITAVGVFVDEKAETVAALLNDGIIGAAQLHGCEDAAYIARLRSLTDGQIVKAFVAGETGSAQEIESCAADLVLIDGGRGEGKTCGRALPGRVRRPYFLAGGITPENIGAVIRELKPFAVDVSSGAETDGRKDYEKIKRVVDAARREE